MYDLPPEQSGAFVYKNTRISLINDEAKASGVFSLSGPVTDGETVTIGADVYEFNTTGGVTSPHILVDVSGGASATQAATALASTINASATEPVGGTASTNTVTVEADAVGAVQNDIVTTSRCAKGTWAEATLRGGVDEQTEKVVSLVKLPGYGRLFVPTQILFHVDSVDTPDDDAVVQLGQNDPDYNDLLDEKTLTALGDTTDDLMYATGMHPVASDSELFLNVTTLATAAELNVSVIVAGYFI